MIHVLTIVTPTHYELFTSHFVTSLNAEANVSLTARFIGGDVCPSGEFSSDGFNEICRLKMKNIGGFAKAHLDDIVLYCDADTRFYKPISCVEQIFNESKQDVMFSNEGNNTLGCGVVLFRATHKAADFFYLIAAATPEHRDDQEALNHLKAGSMFPVNCGVLPDTFYSVGIKDGYWPEHKPTAFPEEMILHHANFTIGIKNKMDLLNYVWQKYRS